MLLLDKFTRIIRHRVSLLISECFSSGAFRPRIHSAFEHVAHGVSNLPQLLTGTTRKTKIVSATALFFAACAFGAAGVVPDNPDNADPSVHAIQMNLALPDLSQQVEQLAEQEQYYSSEERMRAGDTLATLLTRLGVDDNAAAAFIKSDPLAHNVMQLHPGKRVRAQTTTDGELLQLSTTMADGDQAVRNLLITRDGDRFKSMEMPATLERRIEMRSGQIRSSLFAATDAAQIPDGVASQLVDMFSTEVNFASDLRRGDRFSVVYETFWHNGEPVRSGRVLAAEFSNDGDEYRSVWFDDSDSNAQDGRQGQGQGGYYGFDGKSLKKAFLKSPLAFTRISSGFSMRMHPILGIWKQHKGVDFAAPTGTPIRASGDGVIEFVGQQTGYGNVIAIKHWSNYSTLYGHMSRFAAGVHKGEKVSQGEVIGYVGQTGWATGPHLHYEFRINNEPRDPMSVDVPNAQPLNAMQMQRFRAASGDMSRRLALLRAPESGPTKLASN
ncbi:M23 family metallopeptidase [Oxalobacteraceae bacterium CAVE-383]|nr:M23 family metallopeptidase [Oxalobacteraceae bacterium CAVE-383]